MKTLNQIISKANTEILVNGFKIGGSEKLIISGPCTFGSYEELYDISLKLKKMNIHFLRAGAFKFRTNPNSYQGLRDEGMDIVLKIKKELSINVVVEFLSVDQIRKYGNLVDIIQIGSRNMYNTELLKEVSKLKTPVILKRGLCATYKEWLYAASYIIKGGNNNVILCERGIRSAVTEGTRNVLDIQAVLYIKNNTNLPIIVDPSHSSGLSYMVVPLSKSSIVAGADGLLIESHIEPLNSLSDKEQTIDLLKLEQIVKFENYWKNMI